uniref:S12-locus F-box type-17 protein n=1 Tax=Petunia integrifolia subsp. inflata TaxID=212142 RepID=A0A076YGU0_PETIN|nr:S12-locus F-box type-17 protein [Petunia integrifolia subsp. inflata]
MADGIVIKLPKGVVTYIFLTFPVKSLLRLKCVSRNLHTFIQSSAFINLHLNRTSIINEEFILFKRSLKEEPDRFRNIMSFLSSGHDNYDLHHVSPDLDVPYLTTTGACTSHRFMGPCHGLIVFTDGEETEVLFNPSTRNYRLLTPSPFDSPLGFHRSIDGIAFGFDSIGNDYKIVRIAELLGEPPFNCFSTREWRVEVFEMSIDSWREVENVDQQLRYVHWYPSADLFYKGASHWFGNENRVHVIVCFDMCTEIFRTFKMPSTCHYKDKNFYCLVVLNKCLTLICYPYLGYEIDPAIDFMEIWIMKEYGIYESWSKTYRIRPLAIESPLAIWKDHLLLLQSISGYLISYDLNSGEVKEFELNGWPDSLRVTVYKESLALIPNSKRPRA